MGIGGGEHGDYSYSNAAIINIKPDNGIPNADLTNLNASSIASYNGLGVFDIEQEICVSIRKLGNNYHSDFEGCMQTLLMDEDNQFIQTLGLPVDTILQPGDIYRSGTVYMSFKLPSNIEDGSYRIYVGARPKKSTKWEIVKGPREDDSNKFDYFELIVKAGQFSLGTGTSPDDTSLKFTTDNFGAMDYLTETVSRWYYVTPTTSFSTTIYNESNQSFYGYISMLLVEKDGKDTISFGTSIAPVSISVGGYKGTTIKEVIPDSLPNGEYRLYLAVRAEEDEAWTIVESSDTTKESYVTLVVYDSHIRLGNNYERPEYGFSTILSDTTHIIVAEQECVYHATLTVKNNFEKDLPFAFYSLIQNQDTDEIDTLYRYKERTIAAGETVTIPVEVNFPDNFPMGFYWVDFKLTKDDSYLFGGGKALYHQLTIDKDPKLASKVVVDEISYPFVKSAERSKKIEVGAYNVVDLNHVALRGTLGLVVTDTCHNVIMPLDSLTSEKWISTWIYGNVPTDLPDGKYYLQIGFLPTDSTDWLLVNCTDEYVTPYTVLFISGDKYSLGTGRDPNILIWRFTCGDFGVPAGLEGTLKRNQYKIYNTNVATAYVYNVGDFDFDGIFQMLITDDNGNIIQPLGDSDYVYGTFEPGGRGGIWMKSLMRDTIPNLPNGKYQIRLGAQREDEDEWMFVEHAEEGKQPYITLVVRDSHIRLGQNYEEPEYGFSTILENTCDVFITGKENVYTATLKVDNNTDKALPFSCVVFLYDENYTTDTMLVTPEVQIPAGETISVPVNFKLSPNLFIGKYSVLYSLATDETLLWGNNQDVVHEFTIDGDPNQPPYVVAESVEFDVMEVAGRSNSIAIVVYNLKDIYHAFNGLVTGVITDMDDKVIMPLDYASYSDYTYMGFIYGRVPESLPNGTYRLHVGYKPEGCEEWYLANCSDENILPYTTLVVKDSHMTVGTGEEPVHSFKVEMLEFTATSAYNGEYKAKLSVTNTGYSSEFCCRIDIVRNEGENGWWSYYLGELYEEIELGETKVLDVDLTIYCEDIEEAFAPGTYHITYTYFGDEDWFSLLHDGQGHYAYHEIKLTGQVPEIKAEKLVFMCDETGITGRGHEICIEAIGLNVSDETITGVLTDVNDNVIAPLEYPKVYDWYFGRIPESLPNGTYRLYLGYIPEGEEEWRLVKCTDESCSPYTTIVVKDSHMSVGTGYPPTTSFRVRVIEALATTNTALNGEYKAKLSVTNTGQDPCFYYSLDLIHVLEDGYSAYSLLFSEVEMITPGKTSIINIECSLSENSAIEEDLESGVYYMAYSIGNDWLSFLHDGVGSYAYHEIELTEPAAGIEENMAGTENSWATIRQENQMFTLRSTVSLSSWDITSSLGSIVMRGDEGVEAGSLVIINLSSCPPGVYLLRGFGKDGKVHVLKLVKR